MEAQKLQTQTTPLEIKKLQKKLEQSLEQIQQIKKDLEDIKKIKPNTEILSPIANGIFIKTKIIDHELHVNVGNGVVVKKTIPQTQKLLDKQIKEIQKSIQQTTRLQNV